MAVQEREIRVERGPTRRSGPPIDEGPPLQELFRNLSEDATHLIRQEVALGKAELRETASALGRDAAKIGVALTLGWFAALAATTFLIVGIGALIGSYWLSALIVAVLFGGAAAVLASQARNDLESRDLKPSRTIDTLREDADWAQREAEEVKREWKT